MKHLVDATYTQLKHHGATALRRCIPSWLMVYAVIVSARMQSQRTYMSQYRLDLGITVLVLATEVGQVLVFMGHTPTLGGLDTAGMLLLAGMAGVSFSLATVVCGHLQSLGPLVQQGQLDSYYTRPLSVFGQLITSQVQIQKLGKALISLPIVIYALWRSDVHFSVDVVLLVGLAILSGTAIFAALYVIAGSVQFFLVNSTEVTYAVTLATHFAGKSPLSVLPQPLQWLYLVVFPVAFASYLPTLQIVGAVDSWWLPAGAAWWSPIVAVGMLVVAGIGWKAGCRRYQGAAG